MMSLDWWQQQLIKLFEVNHLMLDLMEEVEDDILYTFITNKVASEFTAEELRELWENELNEDEVEEIISDLY